MIIKKLTPIIRAHSQSRFLFLLILILLMILLPPFLDVFFETQAIMDLFLTVIIIDIILAVRLKRSDIIIASILVLPLLISIWSIYFVDFSTISIVNGIFGVLFFGYTVLNVLRILWHSTEITRETIFAAIVAYLLIALMWAFVYFTLELVSPGSFNFPDTPMRGFIMRFEYFSFVTITTLGYGDITPLTDQASVLALVEALIGQIYMVVLVAWLVGMHVSRKSK